MTNKFMMYTKGQQFGKIRQLSLENTSGIEDGIKESDLVNKFLSSSFNNRIQVFKMESSNLLNKQDLSIFEDGLSHILPFITKRVTITNYYIRNNDTMKLVIEGTRSAKIVGIIN